MSTKSIKGKLMALTIGAATLTITAVPVVASAQGFPVFASPQQQFQYGANAFVIQPIRQGAQQVLNKHGATVKNGVNIAKGAKNVYSAGSNLLRYGTAPLIMIVPKKPQPVWQ